MQQEGHLRLGQQLLQLLHLHLEMLQLLHGCDAPFSASLHLLHPLLLPLLPLLPPLLCLLALAAYGRQQRVVPISPLPTSYICLIHIPKTRAELLGFIHMYMSTYARSSVLMATL